MIIYCDRCERRKKCNEEGRLYTFTTMTDREFDPEYYLDGHYAAHGIPNVGQTCPKENSVCGSV